MQKEHRLNHILSSTFFWWESTSRFRDFGVRLLMLWSEFAKNFHLFTKCDQNTSYIWTKSTNEGATLKKESKISEKAQSDKDATQKSKESPKFPTEKNSFPKKAFDFCFFFDNCIKKWVTLFKKFKGVDFLDSWSSMRSFGRKSRHLFLGRQEKPLSLITNEVCIFVKFSTIFD